MRSCIEILDGSLRARLGMRATTRVISLLAALLAGCASYTPRSLDPAAEQAAFAGRSLTDPGLQRFLQAQSIGASAGTLERLTGAAFYYQPELDAARAQWQVDRAAAITAGARPNPTISGSAEYNADAESGVSPWARGLELAIPIETAGKRRQRIAHAVARAEAAQLRLADTAWQVRSRVRAELLAAISTELLLRRQVALETERVRLMQRRLELGFAAAPDLTAARIALQQVAAAADAAHRQQAEHRAALAGAVGVPVVALDEIVPAVDDFQRVPAVDTLPSLQDQRRALLQRPDVQAALADYQASDAALRLELARQYPDLTLSPGLLWDAGQVKWSLGLSLVLPLLDRHRGPIAEATAKREQAAANVLAAQARAFGEAEQALAGYRAVLDQLHNADALIASRQRQVQSAQRLQQAGESERSTTLGAQVELAAAEVTRRETWSQAEQALGALENALRQPLDGSAVAPVIAIETPPRAQDTAR